MNAPHLGVYGLTRSGKSTWVKRELIPSATRVLVIDVNSEYSRYSRTPGPLDWRGSTADLAREPRRLLDPRLQLALEPSQPTPRCSAALLDLVTQLLLAASKDDSTRGLPQLTLVLDECGDYAAHCQEQLATLATRGATHLNVRLVVIAQRPNIVPATVRGNLEELVCFKLVEPLDLKAVAERADKTFAERVKRLPLRKHIEWRATGTTEVPEPPAPPGPLATKELVANGQG